MSIDKKTKIEALQFAAFITEVAEAMYKHKVKDCVCVFGMNGQIRNTYIPLDEKTGEKGLYCYVSDTVDLLLRTNGLQKDGEKFAKKLTAKIKGFPAA